MPNTTAHHVQGSEGIKDDRPSLEEWQLQLAQLNKEKRAKEAKMASLEQEEEARASEC